MLDFYGQGATFSKVDFFTIMFRLFWEQSELFLRSRPLRLVDFLRLGGLFMITTTFFNITPFLRCFLMIVANFWLTFFIYFVNIFCDLLFTQSKINPLFTKKSRSRSSFFRDQPLLLSKSTQTSLPLSKDQPLTPLHNHSHILNYSITLYKYIPF